MTSASVTLHESNLSLHADTFVLCWMRVHHGKVTRHRKPEEWWITRSCAKAGSQCAAVGEGWGRDLAVTSRPCQPLRLADAFVSALPPVPDPCPNPPSPEVADSLEKRNHPRQMGPLTLAGPSKHCVLVTCHLLLFCGWNTSRQNLSVVGETQKKGRGWGKADIASLLSSSKFSERAGIKRRTRLRANKSRAPPPHTHTKKKAAVHPYGSPHHFSPYKTLWAPRRR